MQIYGITDVIPFHLQLRGSSKSLSFLLGLYTPPTSLPSLTSSKSKSKQLHPASHPPPPTHPSLSLYTSYEPTPEHSTAFSTKLSQSAELYSWALQNPYTLGVPSNDLTSSQTTHTRDNESFTLRVYILRQVSAKVRDRRSWRIRVLAEGKLRAAGNPPKFDEKAGEAYALDWEGELQCSEDVTEPSFASGELSAKVSHHYALASFFMG